MRTQVRLNAYERGIIDALTGGFGYTAEAARKLVVRYIDVVRKLGGYDTCRDHAERLDHAERIGYTPEQWMDKIRRLDADAAKDNGIPGLERPVLHVR